MTLKRVERWVSDEDQPCQAVHNALQPAELELQKRWCLSAARKMAARYAIVMHVKPASGRSLQKLADIKVQLNAES
jgi:hypothetical protein